MPLLVPCCPSLEPRPVCICWIELTTTNSFRFDYASMDIEWTLLNRANNYGTPPNNPWSVNNRSFGGEWAYLSLFFTRYLNFASTDRFSRAILKSCNVSKCRSFSISWLCRDGDLIEAAGGRGWRNCVVVWRKRVGRSCGEVPVGWALIRNDGIVIRSFQEKKKAVAKYICISSKSGNYVILDFRVWGDGILDLYLNNK